MDLSSVGARECLFSRINYDLCDKTRSRVALYVKCFEIAKLILVPNLKREFMSLENNNVTALPVSVAVFVKINERLYSHVRCHFARLPSTLF